MLSVPLAQLVPAAYDAVIVTGPELKNEAVLDEKVAIEVSLEDHVVEEVTSLPFRDAKNCALLPVTKLLELEVMDRVWLPVPPVTLPVADPFTPPMDAVMVTLDMVPMPLTVPALTDAQALELCQLADLVTSLEPLL